MVLGQLGIGRLALTMSLMAVVPAFALAQQPPASGAPAPGRTRARMSTVGGVVRAMSTGAGVTVLSDSGSVTLEAPMPTSATTLTNLEAQLDTLVASLPRGSAWAKVYLPEPANGRKYTGDAVANFAQAQASLFGRAGVAEAGKVEILGRQVPQEKAAPMVSDLNLKPYYVVSVARANPASVSGMDPGQRQQLVNSLVNDDAAREQFMTQYHTLMADIMRQLPPDKRSFTLAIPAGSGGPGGVVRVIAAPPGVIPPGVIPPGGAPPQP